MLNLIQNSLLQWTFACKARSRCRQVSRGKHNQVVAKMVRLQQEALCHPAEVVVVYDRSSKQAGEVVVAVEQA